MTHADQFQLHPPTNAGSRRRRTVAVLAGGAIVAAVAVLAVTADSADHASPVTTSGEDDTSLLEDEPAFDAAVADAVEDAEVATTTGTSPLIQNGPAFQEAVDQAVADLRG
jgi:hypothetical protein